MKKVISYLLCFSLIFSAVIPLTANATTLATVDTVEETNFIQQMLDKLEQIIGLMAKTGSITVKCTDENDNVIYQKTDADLKFGSYLADIDLNKIDFSFLGRGRKTPKLQNLKRISSRKSWIVDQKAIQNI